MCVRRSLRLFATVGLVIAGPAAVAETGALEQLARHVPLDAPGVIHLSDIAASRRQAGPFIERDDRLQAVDRLLMPFVPLQLPDGFHGSQLAQSIEAMPGTLGFAATDMDQIAGWDELPAAPVVVTGLAGMEGAVGAALAARDFETREVGGTTVWHRQEDFAIDIRRRGEEPFTAGFGVSQRFAIVGNSLLFSRGWPNMERMLAGGPDLLADADAAAILAAGYAWGERGDLLDVLLFRGQPDRLAEALRLALGSAVLAGQDPMTAISGRPGFDLPGLPPFGRYGLLLWQDGATLTGAIALPFADAAAAGTARERFGALLATMGSLVVDRGFDEILPAERAFEIVAVPGRHVLLLGFVERVDPALPQGPMTFLRTPQRRLYDMAVNGDLGLLIGRAE